jgi:hypothetical protein
VAKKPPVDHEQTAEASTPHGYLVFTINEFCAEHRISRAHLYALWAAGRGPKRKKAGHRTLITGEAAAEWRAEENI